MEFKKSRSQSTDLLTRWRWSGATAKKGVDSVALDISLPEIFEQSNSTLSCINLKSFLLHLPIFFGRVAVLIPAAALPISVM